MAAGELRLDRARNFDGPNPAILSVGVEDLDLSCYPDDNLGLQTALAAKHGLSPEQIVVGNGSDELLDLVARTFLQEGDNLQAPVPSFPRYEHYAKLQGANFVGVPLTSRFHLDAPAFEAAELTILANPNNPTGNSFHTPDVEAILATGGIVVIDEAYVEYGGQSFVPRIAGFPNLIVVRSFSKAYGLAGLRIGWLATSEEIAAKIRGLKPKFNLNTFSENVAIAALAEEKWLQNHVNSVCEERERLADGLKKRGFRVHVSEASFLLADPPIDAGAIASALKGKGILVKTFAGEILDGKIWIAVGQAKHSDALFDALDEVLRPAS